MLSCRCLLDVYVETLSWQLNIQAWIQGKGQVWRHKFGDINIWRIFKPVAIDECMQGVSKQGEEKMSEEGVWGTLTFRDHMERSASRNGQRQEEAQEVVVSQKLNGQSI